MLGNLVSTLEAIDGEPKYLRVRYKNYSIGWQDEYINDKDSERIYNRVHAVPVVFVEDKWIVDTDRIKKLNAWIVCPVGGRIQTYNLGDRWDLTVIPSSNQLFKESPEWEREVLLEQTIRRVMAYIDLNS